MVFHIPETGNAAAGDCGRGASETDLLGEAICTEVNHFHIDVQEFLSDLRAERRRADLLRVSLDCIGLAVSKGVWSVAEARAARRFLPVIGADEFTADFLSEVMRDPPKCGPRSRGSWRRA